MSRPSCLAEADLLALALGDEESGVAWQHVLGCPACRNRLRRLTLEIVALRQAALALAPSVDPGCSTSLEDTQ
jgi:hypothetical protein